MSEPIGIIMEDMFVSKAYKPNLKVPYKLYLPKAAEGGKELALVFSHDGFNPAAATAMTRLYESGEAPPFVFFGVYPGTLLSTLEGGFDRWMRLDNYDIFDDAYPNFIVDELIPALAQKHGLRISPSPDLHLAIGGSSGGISSWNLAWQRNDFFRRVYMSSPSFVSFSNGRSLPELIRKYETKPIKVYVEYSENEPDDYFGSSLAAAIDGVRALKFAGYDMESRYYPGEGHCSRWKNEEALIEAFRFLRRDWNAVPVTALRNSPRFEAVFPNGFGWEQADLSSKCKPRLTARCKRNGGEYLADGAKLYFVREGEKTLVAELAGEIDALAVSSDGWRLYLCGKMLPCIYAMNLLPDGRVEGKWLHASLHRVTDFDYPGATDLCVGDGDRLFAATECGIQCIRAFGTVDCVAPLPNGAIPKALELTEAAGGETDLWVYTASNVFRRRICVARSENGEPNPKRYYD